MPRLPNNLEKRGDRYYVRLQVKGKRGRWFVGKCLSDARTCAAELKRSISRGELPIPARKGETVASFSERWLKERIKPNRNEKGLELARQRYRDHVDPVLGSRALGSIGRADLFELRAKLDEKRAKGDKHLSPQTVRHILCDVRCLLRYANEVDELPRVPSFNKVLPLIPETAPMHLEDEQCQRIIEAASPPQALAIRIALYTGLRWGEVRRLQWHDVHLDESRPYLVLRQTKSGRVRRVPLVPVAAQVLREERARTRSISVVPLEGKTPGTWVRTIRKRSGVQWHFHQLRHTFAHRWKRGGRNKEALRLILGHSTIKLTERYGRLVDDFAFAEAARFGDSVAPIWPHAETREA